MSKQIVYKDDARQKLLAGIMKLYSAVRITMGPKGRNVVLDKKYGPPTITNDGVTIAKEIDLKDAYENMGAQLVKEVATKTNDVAGDGTTTATVLAYAIITEGLRNVTAGANPMQLKQGIDKAVEKIVEHLRKVSKKIDVSNIDEVAQVATISARDPEIGKLIAEVIAQVGQQAPVTVEESQTMGLEKEVVEGMQFDNGYISPYMVTDASSMEAVYENPKLLLTDRKLGGIQDILPLLEQLAKSGTKDLVVIAEDVEGEALATFVVNKLRGTFNVLAVKAPAFGDRRKEMLKDIAALTGGTVISEELGLKLENATIAHLGHADKVIADKDNTTIVGGKGSRKAIDARLHEIDVALSKTTSEFDKEKLLERRAKLSGGVGVIRVGAATEVELKEKKHRIEDAVNATKAALEEGIVPGGGVALLHAISILDSLEGESDFMTGVNIVKRALEYPLRQIVINAGQEGSVIVNKVRDMKPGHGFDAAKGEYVDMVASGIVDPTLVTLSALRNASSLGGLFLTMEGAVTDEPEEKKEKVSAGHSGMDEMGGMY